MSDNGSLVLPSRAMVLAAGKGTRLRPLTNDIPKCMVPVAGVPVLERNINWLRLFGITDLIINLHYKPEAVRRYFGAGQDWGVDITYSVEETLLGTAGAVRNVARLFDDTFFVWYGDNMSTCDLAQLYALHRSKASVATIALFYREDPTSSGIVGLDDEARIVRILEKPRPEQVFSHWVSAGIFVLEPEVFDYIPPTGESDFGHDVLPALLQAGRPMYGYRMSPDEGLWWIDTPADLQRIQQEFAARSKAL